MSNKEDTITPRHIEEMRTLVVKQFEIQLREAGALADSIFTEFNALLAACTSADKKPQKPSIEAFTRACTCIGEHIINTPSLVAVPGVMNFSVSVKRAETGVEENFEMVGTPIKE